MDELFLNQRFLSLLLGDNENDADDDGEGEGNDLGFADKTSLLLL